MAGGHLSFDPNIDPTAGEAAGSEPQVADTQAAPEAPTAAPRTRTYTDADLAGLRRSERTRYEREMARAIESERARWEQEAQARSRQPETPTLDPQAEALLQQYIDKSTGPLNQEIQDNKLDRAVERMKAKYPDFDEAAVVQTARDYGLGKNDDMTFDQILDLAHRYHVAEKFRNPTADTIPQPIRAEIEKAAIAKYVADLKNRNAGTPQPEGRGGTGPVSTVKPKTWKDADAMAREAIKRAREHAG